MNKILPINRDVPIVSECWTAQRLAIILAYEDLTPWVVEKFIGIQMNDDFSIQYYDYYSSEFISLYDEVLSFSKITEKNDIVSTTINAINENKYVTIIWNTYFVEESSVYLKRDFIHDMTVYGYDKKEEVFYFIDMDFNDPLTTIHKVKFSSFEKAFNSAIDLKKDHKNYYMHNYRFGLPASTIEVESRRSKRQVRVPRIHDSIYTNLCGAEHIIDKFASKLIYPVGKKIGVEIYKGYYNDLNNILLNKNPNILNEEIYILWGIKKLIENKTGLAFRLKYLYENKIINDDKIYEFSISNIDTLKKYISNAFEQLVKYSVTYDHICLEKANKLFVDAEHLEKKILEELSELFYRLR